MATRTFLALDLDEAILDRLLAVQRKLDAEGGSVRWVERANLHVTLNFLGDVSDELMVEVCELSAAAAGEVEPFEFDVRGLICTPPRGPLRMLWGGIADPTGRLAKLQAGLSDALAGLGLKEEDRAYRPHITLARIKSPKGSDRLRAAAARLAGEDFGVQHAEQVVAYSSVLTEDGPIYTRVARFGLGA